MRRPLGLLAVSLAVFGCEAQLGTTGTDTETRSPESDSKATQVAREFDFAGFTCPSDASSCPADLDQCSCQKEFDHLNVVRSVGGERVGRYLVMGGDTHRAEVEGMGNRLAVNINAQNDGWEAGAATRASDIMAWATKQFPDGVPQWFFLNEISRDAWTDTGDLGKRYRLFVGELTRTLAKDHGRTVVVFSPMFRPGWDGKDLYPADWGRIAKSGTIGVENYLSGAEVKAMGFDEAKCRARYQESLTAFEKLGVAHGRLILTEHFGATPDGYDRGRAGVSSSDWEHAIRVRTAAAHALPFFGYASYAWDWNKDHRPSTERTAAANAYHRVDATGLLFPAAAPDPAPAPSPAPSPAPTCSAIGAGCGVNACCDGLTCASTCCKPVRSACSTATECCTGRACVGGACCVVVGDGCAQDEQCCNFPAHQCLAGKCCVRAGQGCAHDAQCCSGKCTMGKCG